ncbi:integral membrane protein [Streptococcus varani]|uniref:Integral membrane protein n=1 Tax=Streptococcus varani TaxID=1608583 RepID=A0A0E3WEQ1_9STRE|nr:DUF1304 domain-containing protein [Streptococcus varani]CQR24088.1 integral membrane protein [Streptococcus varani]
MSTLTSVLATLVALEHFYIFYLETLATQSKTTGRIFNMSQEELAKPSVDKLFKNQGVYNGLIAVCLLYGLYISKATELVALFLIFVVAVALYGALTTDKKILLTQGGLAILALFGLLF